MKNKYDHKEIEKKWRETWSGSGIYSTPEIQNGDKKHYILDMFPYPSGKAMHVGHAEGYIGTDIVSRFYRMNGYKVLHPMGWDAFGLPAENYAIKTGAHPRTNTDNAIVTFKEQLDVLGLSYDWDREIGSHNVDYYRWTQWFFLLLYKKGLAYKKEAPVNWCDNCKTVLANEQVVDGKCERCDTVVYQKNMNQWFFKITAYADRLIDDLKKVDWPESTKVNQINWIGRSEGAEIKFKIKDKKEEITVFTTAYDTIFGATFVVLAPEHPLVNVIITEEQKAAVDAYQDSTKKKSELERTSEKDKTGVFTGAYAINPANQKEIPIWIADYVLTTYGTGAVMGVPGEDDRDFEFASKYNLPIIYTTEQQEFISYSSVIKLNPEKYIVANSGKYNGMNFKQARISMLDDFEADGFAIRKINYKLRDWLVVRQRYWGAPVPIVYDPEGNPHPIEEKDLPVLLPDDVEFLPTGESPLKYHEEFHRRVEEKYGKGWKPEVDTLDTFVDSSWYFFRFMDPHNETEFASKKEMNKWGPVDIYVGGAEHTVLHLMYARFFTKVLFDEGYIDYDEPFHSLRHPGMILGEDSRKMSKRWGNVVDPRTIAEDLGVDSMRVYEMFMGPFDVMKPWNTQGLQGARRFLDRVYKAKELVSDNVSNETIELEINKLIKKVGEDIKEFKFNTAVAEFMKVINLIEEKGTISTSQWKLLLVTLAPFAPFVTEELWQEISSNKEWNVENSIHSQSWPIFDESKIKNQTVMIGVQINGKLRAQIEITQEENEATVKEKVMTNTDVQKWIEGNEIKKFIYVPGRIVNIVI